MNNDKKIIKYACSRVPTQDAVELCHKLMKDLPIEVSSVKYVQEFFPLFSQPNFKCDYIVLDVDDINQIGNTDMFDIIHSLHTLINCTVYRDQSESSKPIRRNTKIVALVSEDTHPAVLKEILNMHQISFLSLRAGPRVKYDLIYRAIKNFIENGERAPKFIIDLIKQKKQDNKKGSDGIELTPRQQQILDIIATRGSSNKHIAKMLSISESTVKLHIGSILKKYGVKNRTQLAVFSKKKLTTEVHT